MSLIILATTAAVLNDGSSNGAKWRILSLIGPRLSSEQLVLARFPFAAVSDRYGLGFTLVVVSWRLWWEGFATFQVFF